MAELSRMIYVDDSGSERFGYVVYGWLECAPTNWSAGLADLLKLRRNLWTRHGIPISRELHATEFINGRSRISQDESIVDRRSIVEDPHYVDSRKSHWTQMADFVAYVAYTHLDRHARNEFGWNWYSTWLSELEPYEL